ncbi:MAG: transposase [Candidatus Omnitrophica bacterium]|nr:transposase [Candidatus Omnitrophota bacterium]
MARRLRLFIAGMPYHIIQRGNNRIPVFLNGDDYSFFLEVLREAKIKYPCRIYGYCLMANHFHLLIEPIQKKENISLLIKLLGAKYVRYFNKRYKRSGTLWEGRFRGSLVDKEAYFLICLRYIEMNPVRANISCLPELYPWSSYRFRAFGQKSNILELDPWYDSLGYSLEERQVKYRQFFQSLLPEATLKLIREMTNKNGIVGDVDFKAYIEHLTLRKVSIGPIGRPRSGK